MKVVFNRILPFDGFFCVNLFGLLFIRKKSDGTNPYVPQSTVNHEAIHSEQMKEMGYVLFYLIYFFEWLFRVIFHSVAYRRVSFEIEAYLHTYDFDYLSTRKHYAMWRRTK